MESGDLNVGTVETVKFETIDLTPDNNYSLTLPNSNTVQSVTSLPQDNAVHIQPIILEQVKQSISPVSSYNVVVSSMNQNVVNFTTAANSYSSPNIHMINSIQPTTTPVATTTELYLKHVLVDGQSIPALVDASDNPVSLPVLSQNEPPTNYNGMSISPKRINPLNQITTEDEQPLYVNAKQYQRILKRRQQRAKLEALGRLPRTRQKYMYESRHQHALKRARKAGGKFGSNNKDAKTENNITYCHPKIVTDPAGQHMMEVNQMRVITSTDSPTSHSAIQSLVDAL